MYTSEKIGIINPVMILIHRGTEKEVEESNSSMITNLPLLMLQSMVFAWKGIRAIASKENCPG